MPLGAAHTDGRLVVAALQFGNASFAIDWAWANGRPLLYLGPMVAQAFSPEFATAVANVPLMALAAWLAFGCAQELGADTPEAATAALFCGLNPAQTMVMYLTSFQFQVGYACLFAAAWLAFRALASTDRRLVHTCGAALAASVSAVTAEATTCIIAALPAIWLLAQPATARPAWPAFASLAVWPPLAAAVSFLGYYLAFPASGYFAQERSVGLNLSGSLLALATHLLALAVLLLPAATAIALARFVGTVSDARSTGASPLLRGQTVLACALLVGAGMFAYVLAGRQASYSGWHVRQTLLAFASCAVPFALWVQAFSARHGKPAASRVVGVLGLSLALALVWRVPGGAERTMKHDAFMGALSAFQGASGNDVYCVDDHLQVAGRYINHAEWTAMAQQATGRSGVVALRVPGSTPPAGIARELQAMRDPARSYYWSRPTASQGSCTHWITIDEPGHRLFWTLALARSWATRLWVDQATTRTWALAALPISIRPAGDNAGRTANPLHMPREP